MSAHFPASVGGDLSTVPDRQVRGSDPIRIKVYRRELEGNLAQIARTDVSYFQHPKEMPNIQYSHHDGYSVVEFDEHLMLYLSPDQLAFLYDRLGDAVETRSIREMEKINAALR